MSRLSREIIVMLLDAMNRQPPPGRTRALLPRRFAAAAAVAACTIPLAAMAEISDKGGLVEGGRIFSVTHLGNSGPGSLRTALEQGGPRVIVFEVSGYIDLKSDLTIREGKVTIAGQTAPKPGVIIRGGGVAIRASDVVIEHIAVYPGSAQDPAVAENRDGISLYGSPSRQQWLRNVVLRHVSVGWGVDENIGVQGLIDGLRVEHSLIAEPLRRGGHPKGAHSMNLLLGNTVRSVEILDNVFATGNQRNPRLTQGNIVSMQNNFIYGYGAAATHIDDSKDIINTGAIDIVGNVYRPTAESRCGQPPILIGAGFFAREPRTRVFLADNIDIGDTLNCRKGTNEPDTSQLAPSRTAPIPFRQAQPAAKVYPAILARAGARPAERNPIDARIIAAIADGSGRQIDDEMAVGGWPALASVTQPLALPVPAGNRFDADGVRRLARWLCDSSRSVAGAKQACE